MIRPALSAADELRERIMADATRKAGFTVTEQVGKTGVVAVMKNGPGPTVLIRADMDALPEAMASGIPAEPMRLMPKALVSR